MTYLSGRSNKRKQLFRYFLFTTFFVVAIFFWKEMKSKLYPVVEPAVVGYSSTKGVLGSIPEFLHTYISSRSALVKKDKDLEITIENLENEIAWKDAKLKELNNIVSEFNDTSTVSTLVLYPIMKDITKIYSTILLSKGFKDGVEKDDYVYIRGLQPVCLIKEVYDSTSLCQLLSASGITTEAVASSASTIIALTLTGRGGGSFLADVARDTPISIGDNVYLKSDQSMLIGTVVDVIHNNQDTSWRVFVNGKYNPITSSIFYIRKK